MPHTPGPWRVVGRTTGYQRIVKIVTERGDAFLGNQLSPNGISIGEANANISLAVAAPDLLAALERVLWRAEREYEELTDGEHGKFRDFPEAKDAYDVIAKAKGET
jgi:hypothetical protein